MFVWAQKKEVAASVSITSNSHLIGTETKIFSRVCLFECLFMSMRLQKKREKHDFLSPKYRVKG